MQNFLKRLRKARGMTLKQLSAKSGFGVSTINNFENGRAGASPEFLRRISENLGVTVAAILHDIGHASGKYEESEEEIGPHPRFDYGTQEGSREAFEWLIEHMPLPRLIERVNAILNDQTKPAEQRLSMVKAIMPTLAARLQALQK